MGGREVHLWVELKVPADYSVDPAEALVLFCGRYSEILLYEDSIQMCRVAMAEAVRFPEGAAHHFDVMFREVNARLSAYLLRILICTGDARMIGYVTVGTNDLPRAVGFYDALFGFMGIPRFMEQTDQFVAWATSHDAPSVAVTRLFDGRPATVGAFALLHSSTIAMSSVRQALHRSCNSGWSRASVGAPNTRRHREGRSRLNAIKAPMAFSSLTLGNWFDLHILAKVVVSVSRSAAATVASRALRLVKCLYGALCETPAA